MENSKNEYNGEQKPTQNVMQNDVIYIIKWWMRAATLLLVIGIMFMSKFMHEHKNAWIGIYGVGCVCFIYFLMLYSIYGTFPNRQKALKAYMDVIANLLALGTLIFSYVYIKFFGRAENLFDHISTTMGDVVIGVICGVLLARVAFPLWDLYSKYRKI
ncbi:hypothetical protein LU196_18650 [Pantoea sp. Mb-10]|uniref:hypothetical protein n=1 Tax=unclassified Pantoea TaxID=2630326 RepID=UPI001E4D6483|nr:MULTISPECIES: hypothetical protein [unclassified Pantoea]MCE0492059.1 hypothetical protein [Pantoea sp. Mb-10]MCE0499832.1 hypothetical protein [Pantoea sp. Pb-8]